MSSIHNSIAIILLLIGTLFISRQRRRLQRRDAIARRNGFAIANKHPPKEPLFGFDFQMAMYSDVSSLYKLHCKRGNTFQVDSLIGEATIVTINKQNIQSINTSKDWGVEPMRLPGMEYFCGRGFITTDGEIWYQSRKHLKPSFDVRNLRNLDILSREVNRFLKDVPRDGSTVDLQPLLYMMFLNSALNFVFGVDPSETSDNAPLSAHEFVELFHSSLVYSMFRVILGKLWNILPQGKYIRTCAKAQGYVNYYVDEALNTRRGYNKSNSSVPGLERKSLIYGLSNQTDDRDYIRDQVIQAMMAAQDTTSELLTNALFLLARHSEYWDRLRQEIEGKGEDFFHAEKVVRSRLIKNIIFETLRIYPIFPLLGRVALRDTKLPVGGGLDQRDPIHITKGTLSVMSYYAVHRDQDIFGSDAEVFRPDRWEDIQPTQWEFLGFGAGNRACLGQQKALIEASFVLASMARSIERLESRDRGEWRGQMKMTCKSENGCKVAIY